MKLKLLFFILFLIPLSGFSQSKKSIDSFLDIPFGSDSATVKAALIARGAIKNDTISKKDYLAFTGLSMSTRKVLVLGVKFVDNKVYEADFMFFDFAEADALTYYDIFSSDVASVYGKGEMSNNFGNENNSIRIRKLKSGNSTCSTVWESKNKNTISLFFWPINNSLFITLQYQSSTLGHLNDSKRRSDL
ncbi:MAG: hypothetical protein ABI203_05180 [Mucilaginibacter sp.]